MLSMGLMSGTSMDGIDAALIETDGKCQINEIANIIFPYDDEIKLLLKAAEFAAFKTQGNLSAIKIEYSKILYQYLKNEFQLTPSQILKQISDLNLYFHKNAALEISFDDIVKRSTELHYQAIKNLLAETRYKPHEIDVIGYHGQTLFHKPKDKITIQIGNGKLLAEMTGITTVNDFRSHDVANGGQGAPFAPIYHRALAIRDNKYPLAVVNCGGIANISIITDSHERHVIGFDTGPGNGLIDRLVRQRTKNTEQMDKDGKYGKHGKVNLAILELLYKNAVKVNNENFFDIVPPKSLDLSDLALIPELQALSLEDACRTLEAFTAESIVNSIRFFKTNVPTHWVLCGGGWKNPIIKEELIDRLKKMIGEDISIASADEVGWNSQALEAQIFAYLAVRRLHQLPISTPNTTRVPKPLTGGFVHKPSTGATDKVSRLI